MRNKILWLFIWTTATLWLGNLWGCAARQEGAIGQEVGDWVRQRAAAEWAPAPLRVAAAAPEQAPAPAPAPQPIAAPPAAEPVPPQAPFPTAAAAPEQAPVPQAGDPVQALAEPPAPTAGNVLERSAWPALSFGPADGRTAHLPHYFQDWPNPLREAPADWIYKYDPQGGVRTPLQGARAGNWDAANALGAVAQPVKFGVDMVVWPVKMILSPPWRVVSTP